MKNKIIFLIFAFIAFVFLPTKISALEINYCKYENLSLPLPVTIGVNVEVTNLMYPFDSSKKQHFNNELFVYDEKTCNDVLPLPAFDVRYYHSEMTYYYSYNGDRTYVSYIGRGTFQNLDTTPPIITSLVETIVAKVNKRKELDELANYISASDEKDGRLISEVIYDNYSDNYDKLGTYDIIYQACDKSNNCSKYNLKIKVIDDIPPLIEGIKEIDSYMSNPLSLLTIGSKLRAIDNYDGDISNKITIESNNYDPFIPNTYFAYFVVYDNSNNKSDPYRVEIKVIDDVIPSIEGPTSFNSYLSSPLEVSDILSSLIASDNVDEYIINNLYIINDTYTKNKFKLGSYQIVFGVYDKSGNESLPYIVEVNVIDDLAPTISGNNSYTSYLSAPLNLTFIKNNLIVLDNYDGNLLNKLEVVEDTYSNNKNKLGIYYIVLCVSDSSNNTSELFQIEIIVKDDIPPLIEGTNFYQILASEKLNPAIIKLSLSAYDNIDGDLSSEIILNEDTYSENAAIIGTYYLTFYVCDKSGNISNYFKVKIVVDEEKTLFAKLDNSYIYLASDDYKNEQEILAILGIKETDYVSVEIISDTYKNNYTINGEYKLILKIVNLDYTSEEISINIFVYDKENTPLVSIIHNEKKETIFQKIISFITNLFAKIVAFFKKLFR